MVAADDIELTRTDTRDLYANARVAARIWNTGGTPVVCVGPINPVDALIRVMLGKVPASSGACIRSVYCAP
jgi:hypothetical protein